MFSFHIPRNMTQELPVETKITGNPIFVLLIKICENLIR